MLLELSKVPKEKVSVKLTLTLNREKIKDLKMYNYIMDNKTDSVSKFLKQIVQGNMDGTIIPTAAEARNVDSEHYATVTLDVIDTAIEAPAIEAPAIEAPEVEALADFNFKL